MQTAPQGPRVAPANGAGTPSRGSVALVHEWLVDFGGSEATLQHFLAMFPGAPLYLLFYDPARWAETLKGRAVHPSFLQRVPGIRRYYRNLLPLFPSAAEGLKVRSADLVLSGSHAVAKAVHVPPGAAHVCYCYTPMRYLYDQSEVYVRSLPFWGRPAARAVLNRIRPWDIATARRVDHFIAISKFVAKRIETHYHREAEVIYPPVDTEFFRPGAGGGADSAGSSGGGYFLLVSRLVPYKGVEVAIEAFWRLGYRLKIAGGGPLEGGLKRGAPANVEFLGRVSREELRGLYAGSRALVFPPVEDFGLVPVEAMACGVPVIAYAEGGALETVEAGQTGVLFSPRTPEALVAAVREFEKQIFDPAILREHAQKFSAVRFREEVKGALGRLGFDV